jgi:hypothetical protein
MPANKTILRVQCVPPTKEYFTFILITIIGGLIFSIVTDPQHWLLDAAIGISSIVLLSAFWFYGFVPHQSKRIYVIDTHSLEIERNGKTVEFVPKHEIESVSDIGVAIRITRANARTILLYPGEQKESLLQILR